MPRRYRWSRRLHGLADVIFATWKAPRLPIYVELATSPVASRHARRRFDALRFSDTASLAAAGAREVEDCRQSRHRRQANFTSRSWLTRAPHRGRGAPRRRAPACSWRCGLVMPSCSAESPISRRRRRQRQRWAMTLTFIGRRARAACMLTGLAFFSF